MINEWCLVNFMVDCRRLDSYFWYQVSRSERWSERKVNHPGNGNSVKGGGFVDDVFDRHHP